MPSSFSKILLLACLSAISASVAVAATISGTVKDPSGAFVPGASVEISIAGKSAVTLIADAQGSFQSADLAPGRYELRVRHSGFEDLVKPVELGVSAIVLDLQLAVAGTREEITVGAKVSAYANSDPVYQALRANRLGKSFSLRPHASLKYDVAQFVFDAGTVTFLEPVQGQILGAVFVGQGHFSLAPITPIDKAELVRRSGAEVVEEEFSRVVLRFSGGFNRNLLMMIAGPAETPREAATALMDWENAVRHREEIPRSQLEAILTNEAMDNVAADTLASVYNPTRPGFFAAYIHGTKHRDLRFLVRGRGGAVAQMDSPEEVALLNVAPESLDEGIWYMAHAREQYEKGTASSSEDRRYFAARNFRVETVIGKNRHLTSIATIDLESLVPGERVVKFHLLPNLRVSRVTDARKRELYFIQESRKADGSFYAIFPEPCEQGKTYSLTVEYSGDRVIQDAGTGSFYIGARDSWYPSPNSFGERSLYELTFRVPKQYTLISVGNLESSGVDDDLAVTRWQTPHPVAIAGFNYGNYKHTELHDDQTKTTFVGYYLPDLPDYLAHRAAVSTLAPHGMTEYALKVSRAEVQLCTYYFGPDEFDRLYITEQPNFSFGQSWPNLVYLPISAYTDATQRYLLFGEINNKFSAFVDEVTPHEVSHQWWGHTVGWASYHDQWLSEGFAEFSASLFVEQGQGPGHEGELRKFWQRLHDQILQKQQFGSSPNDAGPLWLGERLSSPRNAAAYRLITYPKGAYVLEMLRSLMIDENGDKNFVDMMHDFVQRFRDQPASTEAFKAVADRHMLRSMDLGHTGTLDWFFNEWVYGTEVPKYDFDYQLTPAGNGRVKAKFTLTQSGVSPQFAMRVPIYADFGKGKLVRVAQFPIAGSVAKSADIDLPSMPKSLIANANREVLAR